MRGSPRASPPPRRDRPGRPGGSRGREEADHPDDGAGAGWEIGWVDVRSGTNKLYFIDYDDRTDSAGVETIAVAPNGDVAFLEQLGAERTGDQMEMIGLAKAGRKRLAEQSPLLVVPDWTIDPKSFEFDGTAASWSTKDGQAGSSLF